MFQYLNKAEEDQGSSQDHAHQSNVVQSDDPEVHDPIIRSVNGPG